MECLLCSETRKDDVNCINMNSSTWKELDIHTIIEKHLWPMTMFKTESQCLCSSCWDVLHEFHKLYMRVKSVHIDFDYQLKTELDPVMKTEEKSTEYFLLSNLCEPQIVLEPTLQLPRKEKNESQSDNDDCCNDEDDIPLINISKCLDIGHSITDSDYSLEDPLNKPTKSRIKKVKKRKTRNSSNNSNLTALEMREVNEGVEGLTPIVSDQDNSEKPKDTNVASPLIIKENKNTSSRIFYYQSRMTIDEYDTFITEHFKLTCNACNISLDTFSELQDHFQIDHNKKRGYVICCGTKYSDRSLLVDHINCHLNPEYFKCEFCFEVLTLRKTFKSHMKSHEIPLTCNVCGTKCKSKYFLEKHKLSHLSEEKKTFLCTVCDKTFATKSLLSSHQRTIHLKAYAKLCEICGQSMLSVEALRSHMQKKHNSNTEPSLSCDICGRLVGCKRSLRFHKKTIHNVEKKDYICPVCFKVSPHAQALRQHVRANHETGYIHKCTVCDKAFKRRDNLKSHMNIHNGTDLFKCAWCPKSFNANSSMHLHRKTMHPKEWEEERRKKYSGNLPPNFKPPPTKGSADNISLQYNL